MAKARMTEVSPTPMVMPVLPPMYSAVAASTPPSRNPVAAERSVSCGMSPRKTFANHHSSFCALDQVRICSPFSCCRAMGSFSGWRARRRSTGC